ncbi:hypothetical protein [Pseudogemmobacter sp. W21_MBD1_M6]|uniref:hypothetical protein n=1 Tax=Pseudogemmobacter sp. W21_MBD1_M6 TaxID=3240271 RepID=UPI003F978A11
MTALSQYQRLESQGLWRDSPDAQRREVIVSFGDATLVISDKNDRAIAHWSLPAISRVNPAERPAVFSPDLDGAETLELEDDVMIGAIEKVRTAIAKSRPQPGRLRLAMLGLSFSTVAALAIFWLPDALIQHTVSVVPTAKRAEIGQTLLSEIRRLTGAPCAATLGQKSLQKLNTRLLGARRGDLVVLASGARQSAHLPGGLILLNRELIENYEEPDVVAGFVLAEAARAKAVDPLERLLRASGLRTSFTLLTTGEVSENTLVAYAQTLMTGRPDPIANDVLLAAFAKAEVRSSPYGYALDRTGETTLPLIEADPFQDGGQRQIMTDGEWVSLQGICGG